MKEENTLNLDPRSKEEIAYLGQTTENGCTERVRALNKSIHSFKAGVCMHRARCYTKIYKEYGAADPFMKRALALKETLTTIKPYYTDGELIVGLATEKPMCHAFQPEIDSTWVNDEGGLKQMRTRTYNPFYTSDEDEKEFREEIYPFWKDKTITAKWRMEMPKDVQDKICGTGFGEPAFPLSCYGSHFTMNFVDILQNGTDSYLEFAKKKLEEYDPNDTSAMKKMMFYRGVVIVYEAVGQYAHNWAAYLRKLAKEKPERKEELLHMADICDHVPMKPARTFHEALQCYWFCFHIMQMEGTGVQCGFGRMDQYLYPYYKKDIQDGILTKEEALELLECFYIKTNNTLHFSDDATAHFFAGTAVMQNIITGGIDKYGNDATNELSYMLIDAAIDVRCIQPALCCRVNSVSPERWRNKILELVAAGMGYPSIFNDDTAIKTLLRYGYDLEECNEWIATGCEEIGNLGHWMWGPGQFINLGIAVDLAFNNGVKRSDVEGKGCGEQISAQTGDVTQFKTYEEFEKAVFEHVKKQLDYVYLADQHIINIYQEYPLMIESVLANDGLRRGLAHFCGGSYSSAYPGYVAVGIPDMIDSLAAVKKLVFDDKVITMSQLKEALDANFVGHEDIYQLCLNAPKYGNDNEYVDMLGQHIMNMIATEVKSQPGVLAPYDPDQSTAKTRHQRGMSLTPLSGCVPYGKNVGALPSGRKAKEALGDSCSPYPGADVNGPTASLRSVGRIPHDRFHGTITNMYITRDVLMKPEGRKRVNDMIRAAFDQGVGQLQFNIMDKNVLRDAQKNPEKYPTLIVRVTGYSAYFVELDKDLQEQIIKRTVHEV